MAGTFMVVLDFFAVNVAIPSMQAELHASSTTVEWVVAGYGVTFSAFLMASGRLGDRVGRRRIFAAGLVLFTLASAGCGMAPNSATMIAARLAQGTGAAMLSPAVLSLLGVLYPGPQRARAISIYGMVMGGAAAAGQLIGGVLVQANIADSGWRSVFLINVPVGVASLVLARRLIPESRAATASRLDRLGMVTVTAGLVALVLPLIQGRQDGWPAWTWVSLAFSPVPLGGFVAHQHGLRRRGGHPMMDLGLFSTRSFRGGLVAQFALWCGQASFFLFFALYLQQGLGLDALEAGGVFTVVAAAYLAVSLPAPALTVRYGRRVVAVGAVVLAAGHAALLSAVLAGGSAGSVGALVPGLVLVGAGMGGCITPLTVTILASADTEQAGAVSGMLSTMQQVGNTVGVAVTGIIFFGALHHGFPHAFALSLAELAGLLVVVAALTRLLPPRRRVVDLAGAKRGD
jgi:EmrB/QacA subfamily drug resistance transporter